jgi:branched-chain amino acid transport system substrate-binding protein
MTALLAAGCGSNTSKSTKGAAAPEPTTNAGKAPIKVGVLDNMTGPDNGEEYPPAVLRAWAKVTNASGGVAGHPVELTFFDTKGDPTKGTAAAQSLLSNKDIVAAIQFDAYGEGVYANTLIGSGLPVIGGLGYFPKSWAAAPDWLSVTALLPSVINATVVQAKAVGAKKVASVICAEVATCNGVSSIAETAAKALGMQYVGTAKIAVASPDYTAQCLQLIQAGADYIALTHQASANLRFAKDCVTQGYKGKFGLPAGAIESSALKKDTPAGVKLYLAMNAFPWFADAAPAAAYRKMMQSQGVPTDTYGDPHAAAAYAAIELFKRALTNYASSLPANPTRKDIIAAYGTVKSETLGGLLPQPITYKASQAEPFINCYWFATFQDGTFTAVSPLTKPTCDPPALQKLYPN